MLSNIYKEQWSLFREQYKRLFNGFLLLFFLSGLISFIVGLYRPDLLASWMEEILEIFEGIELLDPSNTNLEIAWGLFLNNAQVCLLVITTGFIPIFLPAIVILLVNGAMIGVVLGSIQINGGSALATFMAGILPHGLFEIPAILLSAALAFVISKSLVKKWVSGGPFLPTFRHALKTVIFIILPFLLIAAFIEAFITPGLLTGVAG